MAKKETASDDIKKSLAARFGGKPGDWKRRSKEQVGDIVMRQFENDDGETALVMGDGIEAGAAEAKKYLFALERGDEDEGYIVTITPKPYWEKYQQSYDQPQPIEDLLPAGASQLSEDRWVFDADKPAVQIAREMMDKGFRWDRSFQEFCYRCSEQTAIVGLEAAISSSSQETSKDDGPSPA